ncbi:hypothetical protein ARMGADRAFT_740476 [Armillaria gallica]|uniref:F-box domain-containing protein n=1 Tax=Armillaria gallica TaxID=47427 RepID=A0A2H3D407_ARMGA|nr:hypothetical protein ARMGADRAFT_740476 [Armillaria gallica]
MPSRMSGKFLNRKCSMSLSAVCPSVGGSGEERIIVLSGGGRKSRGSDPITLASVPPSSLPLAFCTQYSCLSCTALRWTSLFWDFYMLPMTTPFTEDGISSDSSLSVPQELLDNILDFLHDDIPTLRTCSLVSHAFLPCSRYHIYSSVNIVHIAELDDFREQYTGQLYQCQNLAALLEHSPHVAPLVTRFGIHTKSRWIADIFEDTSLSPIIQSLRNLSHTELICRRQGLWYEFPVATPRVFLATLRSVPLKIFICEGIVLQTQEQFEDLFTAVANPALKHLSLAGDCGAGDTCEPYPPIRPPLDGLPALESLSIAGEAISSNIAWLFFHQSLYDVRGIRHLSLQIYNGTTSSLLQGLLDEMQGSLESFTLDIILWRGKLLSSSTSASSH